jgi:hypothetical protein
MRDLANKTDGNSTLGAAEFNALQIEAENAVKDSAQTPDNAGGPDTDLFQLSRSLTKAGQAASIYQDSGTGGAYVLATVQPFRQPTAYYNGMCVLFKAGSTNSGASTINVSSLGSKALRNRLGAALSANEIVVANWVAAVFVAGSDHFQIVFNSTPPAAGATRPDLVGGYVDNGAGNIFLLVPAGTYIAPASYTNGTTVIFKSTRTITGAAQINLNSLGARAFVKEDGSAFTDSEIRTGDWVVAAFSSTDNRFELVTKTLQVTIPGLERVFPAAEDGASTGTAYKIVLRDTSKTPGSYVNGQTFQWEVQTANTGGLTLAVAALAAKPFTFPNGSAIPSGHIQGQEYVTGVYTSAADRFDLVQKSQPPFDLYIPAVATGSGVPYNLAPRPDIRVPLTYVEGLTVAFRTNVASPANPTINLNSLGAKALRLPNSVVIGANRIGNQQMVVAVYRVSGDRFEVVSESTDPFARALGAMSDQVENGSINDGVIRTLEWATPVYDDLGFYNSGDQNFVVPSGLNIARIGVTAHVSYSLAAGNHCAAILKIGTQTVGVNHVDTASGTPFGEGHTITIDGFPVTAGQSIEMDVQPAGADIDITNAYMTVWVSKFSA